MNIIERNAALRLGLDRYYTGKPCKHGHIAERYVSDNNGRACVICRRASDKRRRDTFKDRNPVAFESQRRARALKHYYGISLEDELSMLSSQRGVCACCGKPPARKRLNVDHNHVTGEVRALLCNRCNTAISVLEDPKLSIWTEYLNHHREPQGNVVQHYDGWEDAYQ